MGGGSLGHQKKILSHLKRIAGRDSCSEGRPLIEDAAFRAKLARAELELESVEATMLRALGGVSAERRLGVEANMIKIRGTELHQLLTELRMEALGYYAEPYVLSALLDGWNEPSVGPEYTTGATPAYLTLDRKRVVAGER